MKALIVIGLALVIFGGGAYFTWTLFLKPQQQLRHEKGQPLPPPPPDPSLPEYEKCVALQESGQMNEALEALLSFVDHNPDSTRIEDARDRLGQINAALFFSPTLTMEKQMYVVKPGDVITKVAARTHSTPELIMRVNGMRESMLRINQRLIVPPADFSLTIDRRLQKVVLTTGGHFFKQYHLVATAAKARPAAEKKPAAPTPRPPKLVGKITDKIAWDHGQRISFNDKAYARAEHWIVIAPSGNSLYTEPETAAAGSPPPQKPPGGGYSLAAPDMQELAAVLRKSDPVTIE